MSGRERAPCRGPSEARGPGRAAPSAPFATLLFSINELCAVSMRDACSIYSMCVLAEIYASIWGLPGYFQARHSWARSCRLEEKFPMIKSSFKFCDWWYDWWNVIVVFSIKEGNSSTKLRKSWSTVIFSQNSTPPGKHWNPYMTSVVSSQIPGQVVLDGLSIPDISRSILKSSREHPNTREQSTFNCDLWAICRQVDGLPKTAGGRYASLRNFAECYFWTRRTIVLPPLPEVLLKTRRRWLLIIETWKSTHVRTKRSPCNKEGLRNSIRSDQIQWSSDFKKTGESVFFCTSTQAKLNGKEVILVPDSGAPIPINTIEEILSQIGKLSAGRTFTFSIGRSKTSSLKLRFFHFFSATLVFGTSSRHRS